MHKVTRVLRLSVLFVPLVVGYRGAMITETSPRAPLEMGSNGVEQAVLPQREFIDAECVICHNQELLTAGLALDGIDVEQVGPNAELWEKVLHKVHTGQMPPSGMPRPDEAASTEFVAWLETALNRRAASNPDPGRIGIHRLNQTEYAQRSPGSARTRGRRELATVARRG